MDQLPRLGKRELVFLLLFTCSFVVSVSWRFLFFLVLGMGWHSPGPSINYLTVFQVFQCEMLHLNFFSSHLYLHKVDRFHNSWLGREHRSQHTASSCWYNLSTTSVATVWVDQSILQVKSDTSQSFFTQRTLEIDKNTKPLILNLASHFWDMGISIAPE